MRWLCCVFGIFGYFAGMLHFHVGIDENLHPGLVPAAMSAAPAPEAAPEDEMEARGLLAGRPDKAEENRWHFGHSQCISRRFPSWGLVI